MKEQLQRKYGGFTALLSVLILTLLGLGACMNPIQGPAERSADGSTGVQISIVTGEERTLLPEATFTKYVLHFATTASVAIPGDETLTGVDTKIIPLAPADWTITVTAYANGGSGEVAAAEGTAQVSLSAGELKGVPIRVSSKVGGGNGYFSYDVQYPTADILYGNLYVYDSGQNPVINKNLSSDPTGNRIPLPAGYYALRVSLQKNYGMAVRTEIVHIYPGMETRGNFVFNQDDFGIPITISGTVDLSGLETVNRAEIRLYRYSDFTHQEGYSSSENNPSGNWSWSIKTLPYNQATNLYMELRLTLSGGGAMVKRLPTPVSVYDQDVGPLALGPFTVNQFNLSGLIDFSDLTSKGITISNATVEVYQNEDIPSPLGNASVNSWGQSWSFGILTEETSLPVRIVLGVGTSGGTFYDEIQTTLTAGRSDLNFKPGPVSAGTTINGAGAGTGYSYVFVPDASATYAFNVSPAGSEYTRLYLYNASGNPLGGVDGYPDAALSYNLTAGAAYYIRLELNSPYRAFQFRVDQVSQINLGGTVNFNGLLSPFSGVTVDSATITIYADNGAHTQLGASSINTGNGSWSATVDLAGSSAPAVFVIAAELSNTMTVCDQASRTISGSNTSLTFSPGAVTGGNAVTRTTINQTDYFLYVPGTTGDYSLTVSAGADRYMNFELYDAQTGNSIGYTSGSELELIRTLTTGNPYHIRVYSNSSQFQTYQFQAEKLQPVTLSGTMTLGGLTPLTSGDINYTEIRIYNDASNPVQLGLTVNAASNGSWSATIPASGSQAVRITAYIHLTNGRTIIAHRQDTISGDTSSLDLEPVAVSPTGGQPVSRVSVYYEDSFLLVPSDGGFFNLGAIGSISNLDLYLYDTATGTQLAQGVNSLYASLSAGTPYIVRVSTSGSFEAYQFRMSALTSTSIGGAINYAGLPSSISSAISSAVVNGYLEPSHTRIVSGVPVTTTGGSWSALIPSNAVGQTIRLVLTLNLNVMGNNHTINSHIQTVLPASNSGLDFAPATIASETTINGKTNAYDDSFLFVPITGGNFALQAWSDTSINITIYDGLTGGWIAGSSSYLSTTTIASLSSGNPYIVRIGLSGYSLRDYQFYAGPPATLGGTVNFSGLSAWTPASAKVLCLSNNTVLGTGTVNLSGGAWSISDLPPSGEVFIALVGLSTDEGVLETQTVSVSGDNNAINFSPEDSDKNVATGAWHNRSAASGMRTWLLWIPSTSGEYVLDTEGTDINMYPFMGLYDGLTGVQIYYSYSGGGNSRIQRDDFTAGHPYLIQVGNGMSASGALRFKAEAVMP
jgi:hypothetical protein